MADIKWTNDKIRLGDLKPWEHNPRYSTERQAERIADSHRMFGQVETVAIDPDGEVLNGHQRLNAWLAEYGADYEIDVRRANRKLENDERQALTAMLHAGAVGSWNWDILANWDADILQGFGFDEDLLKGWQADTFALGDLLESENGADEGGADAEPQIDKAEELQQIWQVQPGDVWEMEGKAGVHRIICGDCTDRAVVEKLMGGERAEMVFTDPPYGVSIGEKNKFLNSIARSNRIIEENLRNDDIDEYELSVMLNKAFDNLMFACLPGGAWYIAAPPGPLYTSFGQLLKERGIWRQTIQWIKNNSTFSPMGVDYHWQAEPIFYGWLPGAGHRYYGGRKQTTVWEIDRPLKSPEHPTMKPVGLVERAIANNSKANEIVLDIFLGSGTTLIACQNLSRLCRGIEIYPPYVAVCLQRYQDAFNIHPQRVS